MKHRPNRAATWSLLTLTFGTLWVTSHYRPLVAYGRLTNSTIAIRSHAGSISVERVGARDALPETTADSDWSFPMVVDGTPYRFTSLIFRAPFIREHHGFHAGTFYLDSGTTGIINATTAGIPWWLPFAACALPAARHAYRWFRRPLPHQCPHCRYDLRTQLARANDATPEVRCPECGHTASP